MGYYGAYNYSGLVRQVSGLINVSGSAKGACIPESTGFKDGGKPCPKTRETAALRRGIQKASRTLLGHHSSNLIDSDQEWAKQCET